MPIAVDNLLAVKAYVLGSEASNSPSRDTALSMVSAAIESISASKEQKSGIRLAFYHLLRSEMLRRGGDPLPDRNAARMLCIALDSPLYESFMVIEEATTSRSKEVGRERVVSAYGSVSHSDHAGFLMMSRPEWCDFALRSLGEDPSSLTQADKRFLLKVTLKDMLRKHNVPFAP